MEGFKIRANTNQHPPLKPIFIIILTITVVILTLPSAIIVLFSKEAQEPIDPPNQIEGDLDPEGAVTVDVFRSKTDEIESVPLEEYVIGVVASEMSADFELEALKAQALAARTYVIQYMMSMSLIEDAQAILDTVQHQVYRNDNELKELWGSNYHGNHQKISEAVLATAGQILTYNQRPITPAFFSTSNGKTENSEDYWENALPYLVSVDSPWDTASPRYLDQKSIPIDQVEQKLNIKIADPFRISKTTYTRSGRVAEIELGGKNFTGRKVRELLGLRSSDFEIEEKDGHLIFTTKGYGHGIGMSQYGAHGMAGEGYSYDEILNYYYQGIEISTLDRLESTFLVKR